MSKPNLKHPDFSIGFRREIDPILGAVGIMSTFLLIFVEIPVIIMYFFSGK